MGYGELSPGHVAEVSECASVIAARAEDNDCTSSVWGYEDGRQIWSVETEFRDQAERLHDEDGQDSLSVQGDPPSEFAAIRDRHLAKRDSDDDAEDFLFMTPVDLAEVLGGWAPEGEIGQDLQFFSAVSNQGGPVAKRGEKAQAGFVHRAHRSRRGFDLDLGGRRFPRHVRTILPETEREHHMG
jgi:hypothetical protein